MRRLAPILAAAVAVGLPLKVWAQGVRSPVDIITTLPCEALQVSELQRAQWDYDEQQRQGTSPFGIPYLKWTDREFSALGARVRTCVRERPDQYARPGDEGVVAAFLSRAQREASQIARIRRSEAARDELRRRGWAELTSIQRSRNIATDAEQMSSLRRLQSQVSGLDPDLEQAVTAALEDLQNRRAEQAQAEERRRRLLSAEQELRASRQAAERADAEARQREAAAREAEARAAARERERQAAAQQARADEARLQEIAREREALDARRREQEAQRERDAAAAQRRASEEGGPQQARPEQGQADASTQQNRAVQRALEASTADIDRIGLPRAYLDAKLMLSDGVGGFAPAMTLREYLAVLKASGEYQEISYISAFQNSRHGIKAKRAGRPAANLVWRLESGELYLAAAGDGDVVRELTPAEASMLDNALVFVFTQALAKLAGAAPGPG